MRRFLKTLGAACALAAGMALSAAQAETVRFWYHFDNPANPMDDLVKKFEDANPGIKIDAENVPWNSYYDNLYTAIVGGSTPWTASGAAFVRTETLATYDARVPVSVGTTCVPRQSTAQGTVKEKAAVRAGYLVGVRVTAFVPTQKLTNGQPALSGTQTQALVLLEINGTRRAALGS